MPSRVQEQSLTAVVRSVLTSTRPEEVILVDGLVSDQSQGKKDEILGFGLGPEITLLAPVLIDFLKEACKGSLKTVAESFGVYLAKKVVSPSHPKIDQTKLVTIRTDLSKRLSESGFEPEEVNRIGDSLISVLVANPDLLRGLISG
jgi:hypothetical protein